jgi:hypothetical protein
LPEIAISTAVGGGSELHDQSVGTPQLEFAPIGMPKILPNVHEARICDFPLFIQAYQSEHQDEIKVSS